MKKLKILNLFLVFITFLYLILALIGTKNYTMFNGDNGSHIVQANYIKENPYQIFGWSRIAYAGYPLLFFYPPLPHLILALLFTITDIFLIYKLVLIMLFTLIPLSFFYCFRKMEFSTTESLIISILPFRL